MCHDDETIVHDVSDFLFGERSLRVAEFGIIEISLFLLDFVFVEVLPHRLQRITGEKVGTTEFDSERSQSPERFSVIHREDLLPSEAVFDELKFER